MGTDRSPIGKTLPRTDSRDQCRSARDLDAYAHDNGLLFLTLTRRTSAKRERALPNLGRLDDLGKALPLRQAAPTHVSIARILTWWVARTSGRQTNLPPPLSKTARHLLSNRRSNRKWGKNTCGPCDHYRRCEQIPSLSRYFDTLNRVERIGAERRTSSSLASETVT